MLVTIDIDEATARRLSEAGITDPKEFAQEAFSEQLDELEDARIAKARLRSPEGWISQDDLERELGLDS